MCRTGIRKYQMMMTTMMEPQMAIMILMKRLQRMWCQLLVRRNAEESDRKFECTHLSVRGCSVLLKCAYCTSCTLWIKFSLASDPHVTESVQSIMQCTTSNYAVYIPASLTVLCHSHNCHLSSLKCWGCAFCMKSISGSFPFDSDVHTLENRKLLACLVS